MNSPITIRRPISPPLIVKGAKTRLTPFIFGNIRWPFKKIGIWYEPFLGSGAVLLNAIYYFKIKKAVASDINPYIINFYNSIQNKNLKLNELRSFLLSNSILLKKKGPDHYYKIREKFNETEDSKMYLFLNLTCYKQVPRFDKLGKFNASFGYRGLYNMGENFKLIKTYLKRIYTVQKMLEICDVKFLNLDFREVFNLISERDFIYFDPPYLQKSITYYKKNFSEKDWNVIIKFAFNKNPFLCISYWYQYLNVKCKYIKKFETSKKFTIRTQNFYYNFNTNTKKLAKIIECIILNKKTSIKQKNFTDITTFFKKQKEINALDF